MRPLTLPLASSRKLLLLAGLASRRRSVPPHRRRLLPRRRRPPHSRRRGLHLWLRRPGATTQTFTLTARAGHITTPDGNTVYMWGFADGKGAFQYPGPNLCVKQGDKVRVILKNTLAVKTSIIFPGQAGVTADGVAAAPVLDNAGVITSLTPTADANGGSVTYSFVADQPGTYAYKSGTDEALQTQMGLFGALWCGRRRARHSPTTRPHRVRPEDGVRAGPLRSRPGDPRRGRAGTHARTCSPSTRATG